MGVRRRAHSQATRTRAASLLGQGWTARAVSAELSIHPSTLSRWRRSSEFREHERRTRELQLDRAPSARSTLEAICSNCGGRVGQTARFCVRCGAPRTDGAEAVPFPGARTREQWDVCEIAWWRGYVKSEFCALALGADRGEYEAGRSRQFRWHRSESPPPDHRRARAAHDELVQKLVDAGWEPLGEATPWYMQRFRRRAVRLRVLGGDEPEQQPNDEPDRTREA